MRYISGLKKNDSAPSNEVTLISSGNEFFSVLVKIINEANHFIYFQTYIFEDDETGWSIKQALINASKRGVKVYLLLDAFGSSSLPGEFENEMKEAGISFRFFGPLFSQWSFHLGRRMHHKIVVVDSVLSLVGGINIGNRYNEFTDNPAWLDFAVLSQGPVSLDFLAICLRKWTRKKVKQLPREQYSIYKSKFQEPARGCFAYARENDSLRNKNQITAVYKKAIRAAQDEIIFAGGYFIPGYRFRKLLKAASRRGVSVTVITGKESDVGLSLQATRFLYSWMFKHRFKIYEYQKSIVHAKVAVVDGEWATIGSYDLNNLSAYTNIEANIDIHDREFAKQVRATLIKIIEENCVQITEENFSGKITFVNRIAQWMSYRIVRLLFSFSRIFFANKGD